MTAGWGGECAKCGHPASYHGVSFCQVDAGAARKRQCDCDGWHAHEPRCECGWVGAPNNHYHDKRMGRAGSARLGVES